MPGSHLIDILNAKHAAFFIAALTTLLAMEGRSTEVIPPSSDRYFNEPPTSDRLRNRIDSSNDSALPRGVLKVRFDDRGPGQTAAEEHRDSVSAGTPTRRTVTVTSTAAEREEQDPVTPRATSPVATGTGRPVPEEHHDGRSWTPWLLIILVVAALIVFWRILQRRPPVPPGETPTRVTTASSSEAYTPPSYPLRIAIKLKSRDGKPLQELDGWQASLRGTAKPLAPLRLLPLFESLDSNRLSELVDRARRNDPSYKPPDFATWFQVETPAGVNADELLKPLRKLDSVETAYVMRPGPPPVNLDDPGVPLQRYLEAAPDAIDARYAWGFRGGDGAGIGFVDLEQGWNLNHRDLEGAAITIISGVNKEFQSHGTSVLGVVLMVDNEIGGIGIAPSATGRVISQWRSRSSYNTADAILDAADKMLPGDVLLLEAQEHDPVGNHYYWPVEIVDANYEMIRLATALDIVVVEAAGNGGYDLDGYINASGKKIFDRTSLDFREDSGAIMVGAGSSQPPHTKLPSSNHGNRIDCYAWGEKIYTPKAGVTGRGVARYETDFGETSGASPIVAGAALILQGIAQAGLGHRLSPVELRGLLTTDGTPSARIGVMPNLRAIITNNQVKLNPVPIPTPGPS